MQFYAHFFENASGEVIRQTVQQHCRSTAQYAQKTLDAAGMGNAAYLAGLLHDMGKMKMEFQDYLLEGKGSRGSVNHTFAGCRFLMEQFHADQATSCEDLTAELLAFAVGAHHGVFDCVDEDGHSGIMHRQTKEKIGYEECVEHFLEHCADKKELNHLFSMANQELSAAYERLSSLAQDSNEEFSFYQGLIARLLLSAVIEGDRRDTGEFMTGVIYPQVSSDYCTFWEPYFVFLENKLGSFSHETAIQRARADISQKCRDCGEKPGGIIRLSVPTGGGKTLSSLRFALSHAKKWGKNRLIFTSPLLTILEQNAAIIREYIGDDSIILEHHSNVLEPDSGEDLDMRELAVDSWCSPVIITTMVQLLNTLFSGKTTAIRRFQSLCNSVIVIDEVQTVPSKMLTLFHLAINFLAEVCNTTVVLCSATQPCLEKVPHPIRPEPLQMIPYEEKLWEPFRRTQIIDGGRRTLVETVDFIRAAMSNVKSLLVICNKKDQATFLLEALEGTADVCCHLSAAMCPAHRRQMLEKLYQALDTEKSCLCVATQVMEAGVDISFQCVIRLTAGMDNVVQAAGRCNRNGKQKQAIVYVITVLDENLSRLEDIRRSKEATVALMSAYQRNPAMFEYDLASDRAIAFYYNRLYGAMPQQAQDYCLLKERTSLFTLLSDNRDWWDDSCQFHQKYMLFQAFRTAGDVFSVFDSDTQDVVVPFGHGEKLIEELSSQHTVSVEYLKSWISCAKAYTVSLYMYQIKELQDVIVDYSGVKVIPPEYYHEQTGFTVNPGEKAFLEV